MTDHDTAWTSDILVPMAEANYSLQHGVLRIVAGRNHKFPQIAVVRDGMSRGQVVVELAGGCSPGHFSYYLARRDVARIEVHGADRQLRFVNSTSLRAIHVASPV